MIRPPWFLATPELLEEELSAFAEAGIPCKVDEDAQEKEVIRISFTITPDNSSFQDLKLEHALELVAVYPDNYPYFRPEIFATNLDLPRHQNHLSKNLCLLQRPTSF